MRWTKRTPRGALVVAAAVLAALVIAACGGSSNSGKTTTSKNAAATSTSTSGASASRTAFTACLKQHGVSLPSGRGRFGFRGTSTTPSGTSTNGITITTPGGAGSGGAPPNGAGGFPGGGGGAGPNGAGFAGGNSKFAKAFQACRSKLPAGSFGQGHFGQGRFGGGTGTRRFTPHFSTAILKSYVACIRKNGYASMPEPKASSNGSFFPASVRSNAQFKTANAKCQSILFRAFRGTAPGPPNTTITSTSSTTSKA